MEELQSPDQPQVDLVKQRQLFELVYDLWDNGENKKEFIDKMYGYWNGDYTAPPAMGFSDQTKTAFNIIKPIIESKLTAMLDAKFCTAVVPKINVFSDIASIKIQQSIADVFDQELKNIFEANKFGDVQERVGRWGEIAGFGCSQVTIESDKNPEGTIKIVDLDPRNVRWNKNAKKVDGLTFEAYCIEIPPDKLKNKYAYNTDGSLNEEISRKIDAVTETISEAKKGKQKGVVAVQTTETSNLAFAYESSGIQAGEICKIVVMFLTDDSIYSPKANEGQEQKDFKAEQRALYPNGRMIVFSPNKDAMLILEDRPSPESFKSLGNIDHFNPTDFDGFVGKSEVEDLVPAQDRVNGSLLKARSLIANQMSCIIIDQNKFRGVTQNAFVNQPVIFADGIGEYPTVIDNGNVAKAMELIGYVGTIYDQAKEMARVNDTMINGMRQQGTTSAQQVEALQESMMGSIRAMQRNFKDYVISVGDKCISCIQEYYTLNRIVKMSTGDYQYARFGENEQGERTIDLINEAQQIAQIIKVNPRWQFAVEVTAGTEIPRSRRENAQIVEKYYAEGLLGEPGDIETKEQLLKSQDIHNWREIVARMKRKQEDLAKNPPQTTIKDILMDAVLAKNFADVMKSLEYNSEARSQILQEIGLNPATDKLDTAPAQSVFSKANVSDVAVTTPSIISNDPAKIDRGEIVSAALIDKQHEGKGSNEIQ